MIRPHAKTLKLAARIILGLIFTYAAWTKLRNPWLLFAISVESYQILPEQGVLIVARVLPWLELGIGILLLAGFWLQFVAPAASTMLIVFFIAMVRSYIKGMGIDCGCFGVGETLGPSTLVRDGLLLMLSVGLTWMSLRGKTQIESQETSSPIPHH
jgi:uncharacterized membrane protein YphA (DoxX/SURF4 family)